MIEISWLRNNIKFLKKIEPLWHPLGFVSCYIKKDINRAVRLHYWPKDERRPKKPNWPVHTHVFNLQSAVLLGEIQDIQYEITNDGTNIIYCVQYDGVDSKIFSTGQKCGIKIKSKSLWRRGNSYNVPINTFHQTVVDCHKETLTLVVATDFQEGHPLVLGNADDMIVAYQREKFDHMLFWDKVQLAVETAGL